MDRQSKFPTLRQPADNAEQPIRVNTPADGTNPAHNPTRCSLLLLLGALVSLAVAQAGLAQAVPPSGKGGGQKEAPVARGEYIVNNVAVCSQCHTPRDNQGRLQREHWLEGASVWLQSAEPAENWPQYAPRIAGALPGTDEEMVTLLTTGIWRTGTYLRPPMPQFRMSRSDAEAVIAYLKSVKPAK
jgi:mono/diheme cytochrome c family protein